MKMPLALEVKVEGKETATVRVLAMFLVDILN
jgi:hypothetical protein